MRFLRFNIKSDRRQCLQSDKLGIISCVWNGFIENCKRSFNPTANLTIDEQLLPCKARCKFLQYINIFRQVWHKILAPCRFRIEVSLQWISIP